MEVVDAVVVVIVSVVWLLISALRLTRTKCRKDATYSCGSISRECNGWDASGLDGDSLGYSGSGSHNWIDEARAGLRDHVSGLVLQTTAGLCDVNYPRFSTRGLGDSANVACR